MEIDLKFDQDSINFIDANLKLLTGDQLDRIVMSTLKEVGIPIEAAMEDKCPVGDPNKDIFAGLLKSSIGMKFILRPGKGGQVLIGPLRNKGIETGRNQHYGTDLSRLSKKGRKKASVTKKIPTRYAHFKEWGTSKMPPTPFVRPAWDSDGGQTAFERFMAVFTRKLGELIARLPQNGNP